MLIDLTANELSLLRSMMGERIIAATDNGIGPEDSSSVFRETLWNKLAKAEHEAIHAN